MTKTSGQWRDCFARIQVPHQMFIDGDFHAADSGEVFASIDPAQGDVIAHVPRGAAADVDRAVGAARRAFDSGVWSRTHPRHRKDVLLRIADAVDAHLDELAVLESRDGGKLIAETTAYDIPGASACLRWYAEAIDKVYGEVAPVGPDALAVVSRQPLGVIGAVVPWNFPLEMAMWKIAPALATGNSVVLKPAEATPLTALYFARLCTESGLPDGVFNVVTGYGPEAGQALGRHDDVDAIAFTGSTPVGKRMMQYAGESNLKQVWPECGGKSAALVFEDVGDVDQACAATGAGIFACAGQVCSANSRLLVHRSRYDDVLGRLTRNARALRIGDPLDSGTQLGPLISTEARERVRAVVERARASNRLVTGGSVPSGLPAAGAYLEPTIVADVAASDALFQQEVFGPVLAVTPFASEEDAIRLANDTTYGLAASVFTADLGRAHRVSAALTAGTVTVNAVDAIDVTVPFGGFRGSGFGRDLSLHAMDKYTGLKTRWFAG